MCKGRADNCPHLRYVAIAVLHNSDPFVHTIENLQSLPAALHLSVCIYLYIHIKNLFSQTRLIYEIVNTPLNGMSLIAERHRMITKG